jgi:hypothetical protein
VTGKRAGWLGRGMGGREGASDGWLGKSDGWLGKSDGWRMGKMEGWVAGKEGGMGGWETRRDSPLN